jgi:hypothetical protein
MKKILILLFISSLSSAFAAVNTENPTEAEMLLCEDQAQSFGNGKGDDFISDDCKNAFKKMAKPIAIKESLNLKTKFFGFRNMILIEKKVNTTTSNLIIAGSSTELKSVIALAMDEKNKEIIALEESGDVLFFSAKLAGNIAPFRILKHKDLVGSTELVVDTVKDQIGIYNNKEKKILFFSRLANALGRVGKQKLDVLQSLQTAPYELSDLSIDAEKGELKGFDNAQKKFVVFNLRSDK